MSIERFGDDNEAVKEWVDLPVRLRPIKAAWDVLNCHRNTHEKLLPISIQDMIVYIEKFLTDDLEQLHSCVLILSHVDMSYRAYMNEKIS